MPDPAISVVICTYNRAKHLYCALRSISEQTCPVGRFEVIVVDNNSKDETREVVVRFQNQLPNLFYVLEEEQGLSVARNRSLKEARAPLVAFLDDDARAEPDWLDKMVAAFETVTPKPTVVGGRVWLDWGDEGKGPKWLPQRYLSLYSYLDHGNSARFLSRKDYLVGANIAFRRHKLLELGGFDTHLGRKGTVLLSGEETAVIAKCHDADQPVYYEPDAVVWHTVQGERQRRRWLLRRMFWDGASQPFSHVNKGWTRKKYLRMSAYELKMAFYFVGKWLQSVFGRDREVQIDSVLQGAVYLGRFRSNLLLALSFRKR